MVIVKPLEWSEVREPNEECRYNHVVAETPFGDFLITWKGWKKYDDPTIDETPWGDWYFATNSLEHAKEVAEEAYTLKIHECLLND